MSPTLDPINCTYKPKIKITKALFINYPCQTMGDRDQTTNRYPDKQDSMLNLKLLYLFYFDFFFTKTCYQNMYM